MSDLFQLRHSIQSSNTLLLRLNDKPDVFNCIYTNFRLHRLSLSISGIIIVI